MATHNPFFVEAGAPASRQVSGLPVDPTGKEVVLSIFGADLTSPLLQIACAAVAGKTDTVSVPFDGATFLALVPATYDDLLEVRDPTTHKPLPDARWHGQTIVGGVGFPDVSA